MIRFLLKGILRDSSRSALPIIVVSIGVMVTVLMHCWMTGIMGESIVNNANFMNGHLKVVTRAYAKEASQMPLDLSLLNANHQMNELRTQYKTVDWVKRIRFGALVDFPDSLGETRAQGPVIGWAMDLFLPASKESERFGLSKALIKGSLPHKPSEALISDDLAEKFNVKLGDSFTLFGTTMDGSMALKNFILAGTVRFGVRAIDRGAIIIDISDAEKSFAMENAANEILGFFDDGKYNDGLAHSIATTFNSSYGSSLDEYSPLMIPLKEEDGMNDLMVIAGLFSSILIFVFVMAMSVVLWNAGLIGSLRRFSEFGVRLAMGEDKNHIFKTLIYEGILIGTIGTIIGSIFGLSISFYLQKHGLDVSGMMKNSSIMMPSVMRTVITPTAYYIGFIPGLISMIIGNALAGLRIYQRKTAQLFKELEN